MAIKSLEGREEWGQGGEYNGGSTMGGVQWGSTMGEYNGGVQWGSTMGGVQWGEYNGGSSRKQMSSPSYGCRHFVQSKFPKGDHLAREKR